MSKLQNLKKIIKNNKIISLSNDEQTAFRQLITARAGIVLQSHQMTVLQETVNHACAQFSFNSAKEFRSALERVKNSAPEFKFLIAGITNGESYFFRDTAQILELRENLLPKLIEKKRLNNNYSLRIWSAGCSNGQEIYSIVIMLYEMLFDIDQWTLYFLATDININVLENGINGKYSALSLRQTPEHLVGKYFNSQDGQYQLRQDICQRVKFSYLNLSEDVFPSLLTGTQAMDIILCRNVFIYLKSTVSQQITAKFSECLVDDGLLLLGASDYVNWDAKVFDLTQTKHTSYFKRRSTDHDISNLETDNLVIKQTIASATQKQECDKNVKLRPVLKKSWATDDAVDDLLIYLDSGRWNEVKSIIEQRIGICGATAELLQIKVRALANLGCLSEALQVCQECLALNSTDKHTYLLQGIIFMENVQPIEAEKALRKAIFLDYTFTEAHYQLGLLHINKGDYEAGLKCLGYALAHARARNPQHQVDNAPGMIYERFVEIITSEMTLYSEIIAKEASSKTEPKGR